MTDNGSNESPQNGGEEGHHKNRGFSKLVEVSDNHHDLVGLVAYGLYKTAKYQYIETGLHSDQEIDKFSDSLVPDTINQYRNNADQILGQYALITIDAKKPGIIREHENERTKQIAEQVSKIHSNTGKFGTFLVGFFASSIAVIFASIIIDQIGMAPLMEKVEALISILSEGIGSTTE